MNCKSQWLLVEVLGQVNSYAPTMLAIYAALEKPNIKCINAYLFCYIFNEVEKLVCQCDVAIKINKTQTCTCNAKQLPTPPSAVP